MTRVLRLCAALAAIAFFSGCAEAPSAPEATMEELDRAHGPVGSGLYPRTLQQGGRDGRGISMFRLIGDGDRFGTEAPRTQDDLRVVDVAVDMRLVGSYPVYRLGVAPVRLDVGQALRWDEFIHLEGNEARLVSRLPAGRDTDADGIIWSDWTYCGECFDMEEISLARKDGRSFTPVRLEMAQAAATRLNGLGSNYQGALRFLPGPGASLAFDTAAFQMAQRASEAVVGETLAPQSAVADYPDYETLRAAFAASEGPASFVAQRCGAPAGAEAAYLACREASLEIYDLPARAAQLNSLSLAEAALAARENISQADRLRIPTLSEELAALGEAAMPAVAPVEGQAGPDEGSQPVSAPAPADPDLSRPAARDTHFVARLLPDGANEAMGEESRSCVAGLRCEVGSIIALIGVESYCGAPGEVTQTRAGAGIVVQRYFPANRAEEKKILAGDDASIVHLSEASDLAAARAGVAAARAIRLEDHPIFFTSYMDFYQVNTEQLQCRDMWRDAARARVVQNNPALIAR